MSNDINLLGSLLRQLQQGSGGPAGYGLSPLQGSASAGQILPPDLAGGDPDGGNDPGSTSAASVTGAQLPSQAFSADILRQLLARQQDTGAPPSSSDIAKQLISNLDGNGDGKLSLAEVEKALGIDTSSSSASSAASTSATDPLSQLTAAFNKLDTNGDGQVSSDELAAALDKALESTQASQARGARHHHHHLAYQTAQASADAAATAAASAGAQAATTSSASSTVGSAATTA